MTHSREDRLASELASKLAGCPDADTLQRYQAGEADDPARAQIERHLTACEACAQAIEFLHLADARPAEPAELPFAVEKRTETLIRESIAPSEHEATSWWPQLLRVAAGVMLLAAVAVGGYRWLGPGAGDDLGALRGDEPLTLVAPVGSLPSAPRRMEWITLPGSSEYRVTLLDDNLEEIWSRRTGDDTGVLSLDGSSLAAITPGRSYTWRVEALDDFGGAVATSPAAHFEVAAE